MPFADHKDNLSVLDSRELLRELMPALALGSFLPIAEERTCRGCSTCCVDEAVEGLARPKPAFSPCPHLDGQSCAIYRQRPEPCRFYYCGWRMGIGPQEIDPRHSGVLISMVPFATERDSPEMWSLMLEMLDEVRRGRAKPLSLLCAQVIARRPYDASPVYAAIGQLYQEGMRLVAFTDRARAMKSVARTPNREIAYKWLLYHAEHAKSPWNDDAPKWMRENGYDDREGIVL